MFTLHVRPPRASAFPIDPEDLVLAVVPVPRSVIYLPAQKRFATIGDEAPVFIGDEVTLWALGMASPREQFYADELGLERADRPVVRDGER